MKKQRGLTLLEIIISLGIMSTVIMGVVKLQENVSEDTRSSVNALHIKAVGQAAQEYIKDNYATLTGVASATNPALIRVSDLIAGGYLNSGFSVKNEKQQDTCVLVIEPTANKLMALVATEGGTSVNDLTLGQIASTIGGEGGGIYSTNTGEIRGAMGGWSVNLTSTPYSAFQNTNNLGLKCDGSSVGSVSLTAGHPFMALWFASGGNLSSTLYRDAVPGNPTLNTMNTPIIMGSGTVQTSGSACTNNGALGRDAAGSILSCVSNVWTAPNGTGSPYWGDPVATFSALPVCNAANTGQTRVVRTPTIGTGARAYTCNGSGTWNPLSISDDGNITVPGTANIDKLSGNLQITSTATENTACSPNGRIASDANGLILSCQSGSWKYNQVSKTWVTFNGMTGVITSSNNVASVFKNTTGHYTIYFQQNQMTINYGVLLSADYANRQCALPNPYSCIVRVSQEMFYSNKTLSSVDIFTGYNFASGSGGPVDYQSVTMLIP